MEKKDAPSNSKAEAVKSKVAVEPEVGKSKKGLIIALVSLVIIAVGAVAAFLIINCQNKPESVVLDAVTKTIKQQSHKVAGTVEMTTNTASTMYSGNSYKSSVRLELEAGNNGLNNAASAVLTVKGAGPSDYVFRFNEVLQDNGTLYIRVADFADFINSIAASFKAYLGTEPFASLVSQIKTLATKIEGSWWRVSVPEIFEAFGVKDDKISKQYDCVITAVNKLASESGLNTVADNYKNNQFLSAKKSDRKVDSFTGSAYEATIDTNKLAKFWNSYIATNEVKEISACVADRSIEEISADSLSRISGETFLLDIDNDKNLKGIYLDGVKDSYTIKGDLRVEEGPKDQTFTAPADAKPITDLTSDVMKIVQSIAGLFTAFQSAE